MKILKGYVKNNIVQKHQLLKDILQRKLLSFVQTTYHKLKL